MNLIEELVNEFGFKYKQAREDGLGDLLRHRCGRLETVHVERCNRHPEWQRVTVTCCIWPVGISEDDIGDDLSGSINDTFYGDDSIVRCPIYKFFFRY